MKLVATLLIISITVTAALPSSGDDGPTPPEPVAREPQPTHRHTLGCDILDAGKRAGVSFLKQFTEPDSLFLMAGVGLATALLAVRETGLQQSIEDAALLGPVGQKIGDVTGVALNFGLVPIGVYTLGRWTEDDKAVHFAIELAATQAIALVETFAISQLPFHQRPLIERGEMSADEGNFLNDTLRGRSSYPSGHMIGIAAVMFQGWQWYSWRLGLPATLATAFIGWARVEEGQHYVSDIFGTIAITGIAALAVSRTRDLWSRLALGNRKSAQLVIWPTVGEGQGQMVIAGRF